MSSLTHAQKLAFAREMSVILNNNAAAIAFMIVAKDLVNDLRQSLKPHQGFLVE
jgi:hypothetical protein